MKKLTPFLQSIRSQLVTYVTGVASFGIVAFLTRFPATFFWYSVLLFTSLLLIYLLIQGVRYVNYYRHIEELTNEQILEGTHMPATEQPIDQLYQEKLIKLAEAAYQQNQRNRENQQEQLEYFTLWLHQIKTPIAAMSLLNQSAEESQQKRQFEQELIRVEDYTHMALNYLKLTEQSQELDIATTDVDKVIRTVIKKYAVLFIYNHIQLDYEPTHLAVVSDRKWLEVLLELIISNSLKYAPKGKIRIYAVGDTLVVEDNGRGIRAEDLPKIFQRGYSGMNGRLHEKSTGLGLFLSQKICDRLGHRIKVESKWHEYTKVSLDLSREQMTLFD